MDAALEHYHLFETAFGRCGIAWSAKGLTRVQLPEADDAATERRLQRHGREAKPPPTGSLPDQARAALVAYFAGATADLGTLDLDWSIVGDFERHIYRALRRVPRGETTTYGALATATGQPGAARAVGRAMGANPWPIIVPCHRVLAAGQGMGGFSAYGAVMTKERLLALEGAAAAAQGRLPGL